MKNHSVETQSISEESFAKVFRASPAPMVLSNKHTGEFYDVNDRWIRLIGYTPEEMLGRTSKELGIWVDWESRRRIVEEFEATGLARDIPTQIRTKGGELRDVLWSLEFIHAHGRECMLSLLYDVTELRRSQEAVRTSEERFKRLMRNSTDITSILDATGKELAVYGPVERVLGYTAEELVGTTGFDHVEAADHAPLQRILSNLIEEPGSIHRAEYRHRRKDGTWVAMETVGTNLLHDPLVGGIVLNSRDVTERNRLQEQLQQAMKMEAVGRLAGGIAHDFNNLLTAILGNLELARLEVPDSAPLCGNLDEVQRAAKSAAALTRQLLSFSRRQIIEPKILSLNDLVANLRTMLGRLLGEDVTLSLRLDETLGRVRVDPGQFEQVLVNLAVNARDAMPRGGRLIIETTNIFLDEAYCRPRPGLRAGRYALLSVSDTGVGMTDEVKQRLFEPFFTTKPKGRGTGLGLATIFGTVKQAAGHIEAYSELGLGTTFKICLPIADGPGALGAGEQSPLARSKMGEKIMLVEDDASVRGLTLAFLNKLGYKAFAAASPAEALTLVKQPDCRFDLLMTDVVMPGMNGRELAERMVALRPGIRVLFTSGYTEDVIVHHGVMDAQVNFLAKPYTMDQLADKLREILEASPH